ncbi:TetR/AcrR family transcriptional regulator [Actinocorallia sp. API 0066]|uniref:TetR/AcrR family transcriptional regulator n=1 Tax=Actinocorallia sp. API 0066 TaxID=2896846 RepID=UPI001E4F7783|nr:TetR/AcrR family transcriptional regulator [Actinocorallia sp. API 0066]MCD0451431.1 TetR/AcrR family transcriptional regulator [Actinocorallia sp. API 0066]
MTESRARNGTQWARADATRRALLDAAREVFSDRGYEAAGIAEIVERSGVSVGSLYHHYGGKSGLFLALWEEHTAEQERMATRAVKAARAGGEKDSITLFITGTAAFLEFCWDHRRTSRLFVSGEGPTGFGLMRRSRMRQWLAQNTRLLSDHNQMLPLILTTAIGEAGREVSIADSPEDAHSLITQTTEILRRLAR